MHKRYISWAQLNTMVASIARDISNSDWRPDRIVGLGRGGLTAATMLSHYFNIPMSTLDVSLRDDTIGPESNCWIPEDIANHGHKILVVDDINDTGATINWIKKDWDSSIFQPGAIQWGDNVRFAVLVDNEASLAEVVPTYSGETINKADKDVWIVFPFENWWTQYDDNDYRA